MLVLSSCKLSIARCLFRCSWIVRAMHHMSKMYDRWVLLNPSMLLILNGNQGQPEKNLQPCSLTYEVSSSHKLTPGENCCNSVPKPSKTQATDKLTESTRNCWTGCIFKKPQCNHHFCVGFWELSKFSHHQSPLVNHMITVILCTKQIRYCGHEWINTAKHRVSSNRNRICLGGNLALLHSSIPVIHVYLESRLSNDRSTIWSHSFVEGTCGCGQSGRWQWFCRFGASWRCPTTKHLRWRSTKTKPPWLWLHGLGASLAYNTRCAD